MVGRGGGDRSIHPTLGLGCRLETNPKWLVSCRASQTLPGQLPGRVIHEAREDDMRLKTLAAIVSFVLLTLNYGAGAQQSGRSVDTSPAWNDNHLITVQKNGGDPTRSGDVKIEFYGHDAMHGTAHLSGARRKPGIGRGRCRRIDALPPRMVTPRSAVQ
jgi:hypothetical protein